VTAAAGDRPVRFLSAETIQANYIAAVVDIWDEQRRMGTNRYDHPRGKLVKGIIKDLKVARVEERWRSFEDRALKSLNDGYSRDELHLACVWMLRQTDRYVIPLILCCSTVAKPDQKSGPLAPYPGGYPPPPLLNGEE